MDRFSVVLCVAGCFWTVSRTEGVERVGKELEKGAEDEAKAVYASLGDFGVRLDRPSERVVPEVRFSSVNHEQGGGRSGRAEVYWKDNSETSKLRQERPGEPTITRVVHHGIYPSLNVTEPIGRANNSSRFKSRTKRDRNKSNGRRAGSGTTVTDFRYEEAGTSSATFHQESTLQVKNGQRTVIDRRNNQDGSVHLAYQAQYPPNSNTGAQSYPNSNTRAPNYPNYDARAQSPSYNNARVQRPPKNGNRPGNNPWVRTTTPRGTKYVRAKRETGLGSSNPSNSGGYHYRYDSDGSSNGTHHLQTSTRLQNGTSTVYRRWDNQNGTVKTTYQAQYPPYKSTSFHSNFDSTGNLSYVRARHPVNGSRDFRFYTHQFEQPSANGTNSTAKYRTLYYPQSNSVASQGYKGDTSNKGNVRLISVGYYSVNESRDGVRSYYNPPGRGRMGLSESPRTNGFEPSRYRRDAGSWSWLDKLMVSIGLAKLENAKKEMAAGSETVKLEMGDGRDEVLQNQYGYSSNGHHHVVPQEDQIYVVGSSPSQTTTSSPFYAAALSAAEPEAPSISDYEDVLDTSEALQELLPSSAPRPEITSSFKSSATNDLPKTETVLIQAPPRFIVCEPPLRVARGRCRRVWRSRL